MMNSYGGITLTRYFRDIAKSKPISKEEEQALFRLVAQGNELARRKLVEVNMRFVVKIALKYRSCPIPIPDLISEGSIGLYQAIDSFDHTRGLRFISFAVWSIRKVINEAIENTGSTLRLPRNQHDNIRKHLKETQGNPSKEVEELLRLRGQGTSLDHPVDGSGSATYSEVIPDPSENTENAVLVGETRETFENILSLIPERDSFILRNQYGVNQEYKQYARDLAPVLGITHQRVSQLSSLALGKLREEISPRLKTLLEDF